MTKQPKDIMLRRNAYVLKFNPLFAEKGLSAAGLRAILAHEVSHALCYQREGFAGLLKTAIANIGHEPPTGPTVERAADVEAIIRGFGPGLAEYRTWQYALLDAETVRLKRKTYFTPEEALAAVEALATSPALAQHWRASPPLSLQAIQDDIRRFKTAGWSP